jgi:hypothetical protein
MSVEKVNLKKYKAFHLNGRELCPLPKIWPSLAEYADLNHQRAVQIRKVCQRRNGSMKVFNKSKRRNKAEAKPIFLPPPSLNFF